MSGEVPAITIQGITFRLLKYDPGFYEGRGRIVYESSAEGRNPEIYAAYQSLSEQGIWRLCLAKGSQVEKGADYIQSSLINFELQKFINETIARNILPTETLNYPVNPTNTAEQKAARATFFDENKENDLVPGPCCKYTKMGKDQRIRSHLNDADRIISIPELIPYIRGSCNTKIADTEKYNEMSNYLENSPEYDVESIDLIYPNYTFIYKTTTGEVSNLAGTIYSCDFRSNARLIFMRYNVTITKTDDTIVSLENKYVPIAFILKDSVITEYGTYSRYIYAGLYVCKIFNYTEYSTRGERTNKRYSFGSNYTYIGDRYTNLYPYKFMKLDGDRLIFSRPLRIRAKPRQAALSVRQLYANRAAVISGEVSPGASHFPDYLENRMLGEVQEKLRNLAPKNPGSPMGGRRSTRRRRYTRRYRVKRGR